MGGNEARELVAGQGTEISIRNPSSGTTGRPLNTGTSDTKSQKNCYYKNKKTLYLRKVQRPQTPTYGSVSIREFKLSKGK